MKSHDDTTSTLPIPDVSVIIVNFNSGKFLKDAVKSLLDTSDIQLEIIIVDNASFDDSLDGIEELSRPTITVQRMTRNLGFSHSCNIGQAKARGRNVLFLNPDCRVTSGSIRRMSRHLDKTRGVGIVGPLIVGADGLEQPGCRRDIPTPVQMVCVLLGIHKLLPNHPRFRHFNRTADRLPSKPTKVHAVSGACMMVPRRLLDEIGAFDENYFLHFEDVDLCLRFAKANAAVYFLPKARIFHYKGACSIGNPIRVHWSKHQSMMIFFKKHFFEFYPSLFLLLVNTVILFHFLVTFPITALLSEKKINSTGWDNMIDG